LKEKKEKEKTNVVRLRTTSNIDFLSTLLVPINSFALFGVFELTRRSFELYDIQIL